MPKLKSKAVIFSVIGHIFLLIALFQLGHSQTIPRNLPRTISATLLQKGPMGLPRQSGSSNNASQGAAEPAKKSLTPPPKTPIKKTPKQQTAPTLPAKKTKPEKSPPTTAKNTSVTPSKNPFAKGDGGTSPKPVPNKNSGSGSGGNAPIGSKTGTGGGGGVRIEATEFPFPYYLPLLQRRIEGQWHPPYVSPGEYLATVRFVISKSGKVLSTEIEKSSDVFAFDQAALRAVQSANPLPALPEGFKDETLVVRYDFYHFAANQ